ncbi:MAG: hypothetical protein ACLGI2_16895 [Acidimicrobiia bacterium]
MQDGLSQDQIALVLRRAAELDRELGAGCPSGLDDAAVEQAAVEAGISSPAVRRALAEWRAGVLAQAPGRSRHRILGPPTLTVCRTLPGPVSVVEDQLHRFLRAELFDLRRDMGARTTWVRRRSLEATARRAVDRAVNHRLVLRDVNHVDLSIVEQDDDWVLVRVDVDVLALRHAQGTVAGSATFVGSGATAFVAALNGLHPAVLVVGAAGAGVMGAGLWVGSSRYRKRAQELESGLGGVLDRIERGRTRLSGRRGGR